MNREQKKRITQNITCLKERLIDLDPILDVLIERDVLTMEHRNRIEQISCPTAQRKFNEFVSVLLASPNPAAYHVFIEALQTERHFFVVEKLQNTIVKDNFYQTGRSHTFIAAVSRETRPISRQTSRYQEKAVADSAGASGPKSDPNLQHDISAQMSRVLSVFCDKMTDNFAVQLEEERRYYRDDMEKRMEERFNRFHKEWSDQKDALLQRNDEAIGHLRDCVDRLHQSNTEYERLREKYDKLKILQQEMRGKENERWQKLTKSNMENVLLSKENEDLRHRMTLFQDQVLDLTGEVRVAKDNERQDRCEIERLSVENTKLEQELYEREREKGELKQELEEAYSKIHTEMATQRENSTSENTDYKDVLERQNTKLDEIFAAMKDLRVTERTSTSRPSLPRTLAISGNVIQKGQKTSKK